MSDLNTLRKNVEDAGQQHLWAHYESLATQSEKDGFAQSLREVGDFKLLNSIFKESMKALEEGITGDIEAPAKSDFTVMSDLDVSLADIGFERMAAGEVAVLILAGGSGTRLGQTLPKGMFVCPDLVQPKSLFQLQCEKIRRLEEVAAQKVACNKKAGLIQLLYMTSEQTDADTRAHFEENKYFGLQKEQFHFFSQPSIPSMSTEGKILIRNATELCTFPGGNAGFYGAIATSGVLDIIASKGVKYVQTFTVDNILCKLGDPSFTGYAHTHKCDVVVKACPKARDHEAVGVFAKRSGKWGVVEYTEIGKDRAEAKDANGKRIFDAANIAIYLYSIDFLKRAAERMKSYTYYHVAKKSIPTIEGTVAGVKLEAFIFDLFEFANSFAILSVERPDEFSAIKNADDEAHTKSDTAYTAVLDLRALHWRWVKDANATLKVAGISDIEQKSTGVVEISPLVSYGGEGISADILKYIVSEASKGGVVSVEPKIASNL